MQYILQCKSDHCLNIFHVIMFISSPFNSNTYFGIFIENEKHFLISYFTQVKSCSEDKQLIKHEPEIKISAYFLEKIGVKPYVTKGQHVHVKIKQRKKLHLGRKRYRPLPQCNAMLSTSYNPIG